MQILFAAFVACFVAMASALKPLQTEDVPVNGPVNGPVGGPVPVPSFDGQGPTKGAINEHPRDKKFACKLSTLKHLVFDFTSDLLPHLLAQLSFNW